MMTDIRDFETRKQEMQININAAMRALNTQITTSNLRLFGNPMTGDGGYSHEIEPYLNNPAYKFEPFQSWLPLYINESKSLITTYSQIRFFNHGKEGDEKNPGAIKSMFNLMDDMIAYMHEAIIDSNKFKEEIERLERELQRREDIISELNKSLDAKSVDKYDEKEYMRSLVDYYCRLNNLNPREFIDRTSKTKVTRSNMFSRITRARLRPLFTAVVNDIKVENGIEIDNNEEDNEEETD